METLENDFEFIISRIPTKYYQQMLFETDKVLIELVIQNFNDTYEKYHNPKVLEIKYHKTDNGHQVNYHILAKIQYTYYNFFEGED